MEDKSQPLIEDKDLDEAKAELVSFLKDKNTEREPLQNEFAKAIEELDLKNYEDIISKEIMHKKEASTAQTLISIGGVGFGSYLMIRTVRDRQIMTKSASGMNYLFAAGLIGMNMFWLYQNILNVGNQSLKKMSKQE